MKSLDHYIIFMAQPRDWKMQGFHFHKQYEIILFMSEGAKLEIKNRIYHTKPGDIFFINSTEYHRTEGREGEEYNRYVLMFEPEIIEPLSEAFGYNFNALFEEYAEEYINCLHLSGRNLKLVEEKMKNVERSIAKDFSVTYNKNAQDCPSGSFEYAVGVLLLFCQGEKGYDLTD